MVGWWVGGTCRSAPPSRPSRVLRPPARPFRLPRPLGRASSASPDLPLQGDQGLDTAVPVTQRRGGLNELVDDAFQGDGVVCILLVHEHEQWHRAQRLVPQHAHWEDHTRQAGRTASARQIQRVDLPAGSPRSRTKDCKRRLDALNVGGVDHERDPMALVVVLFPDPVELELAPEVPEADPGVCYRDPTDCVRRVEEQEEEEEDEEEEGENERGRGKRASGQAP